MQSKPTQPQLLRANVNELIRDRALPAARAGAAQGEAQVRALRADVPDMPLDANQMKQAFYNLIRNSCQAMPDGGRLTVMSTYNDHQVIISFQDVGKGISRANMGNLFQPFFTTRKTGTGLGLLIVRRILREHGGEIIESREGAGDQGHPVSAAGGAEDADAGLWRVKRATTRIADRCCNCR